MIYSFNAKDNVMYSVIKSSFGLSDEAVYKTIQDEFSVLLKRLSCKKVPYEKLKGALVPNQEANMYETCLVVDWMQIDDCNYGGLLDTYVAYVNKIKSMQEAPFSLIDETSRLYNKAIDQFDQYKKGSSKRLIKRVITDRTMIVLFIIVLLIAIGFGVAKFFGI